ncbi:leucyl/phenylalanyl-tRNA--protein transferase [Hohaiivirga grylli]
MSDAADDPSLFWVEPKKRGIIPLDDFHLSKRLAKTLRTTPFEIRIDSDFQGVIEGCSTTRRDGDGTWINARIKELYGELFNLGFCHTVEVYNEGNMVGGLYGISLASAFFGESMFHRATDASKIALCYLVATLKSNGFTLLDTQFQTDHLAQFGTIEISQKSYLKRLHQALSIAAHWPTEQKLSGQDVVEILRS